MNSAETFPQFPEDTPDTPELEHSPESLELLAEQSAEIQEQIEKAQETVDSLPDSPEKEVLTDMLRRAMRHLINQKWVIAGLALNAYGIVGIATTIPKIATEIQTIRDNNEELSNPLEIKINPSHISSERKGELSEQELPEAVPRQQASHNPNFLSENREHLELSEDPTFQEIYTSLKDLLPAEDLPFHDFGDPEYIQFLYDNGIFQSLRENSISISPSALAKLHFNITQLLPRMPEEKRSTYLKTWLPGTYYLSISSEDNEEALLFIDTPIQELYTTLQEYFDNSELDNPYEFGDPAFLQYLHDNQILSYEPNAKKWLIDHNKVNKITQDIRYLLPLWKDIGDLSEILWQISNMTANGSANQVDTQRINTITQPSSDASTGFHTLRDAWNDDEWDEKKASTVYPTVSELPQETLLHTDNMQMQFVESPYPLEWQVGIQEKIKQLKESPLVSFQLKEIQQLAKEHNIQYDIIIVPVKTSITAHGQNTTRFISDNHIQSTFSLSPTDGFSNRTILNELSESLIHASDLIQNKRYMNGQENFQSINNTRELQLWTWMRDRIVTEQFFSSNDNTESSWKRLFDNLEEVTKDLNDTFQRMQSSDTFYDKQNPFIHNSLSLEQKQTFASELTNEVFVNASLPFKVIYNEAEHLLEVIPDSDMSLLTPEQRETVLDLLDESEGLQQEQSLNPS